MADIAFWNGLAKRIGIKLTDKLLIGNIDTGKPQYVDVQDLPYAKQADLAAEATARQTADTAIIADINAIESDINAIESDVNY